MEARFSAPVQTDPGAHPAPYTMGTGPFPGVKREERKLRMFENLVLGRIFGPRRDEVIGGMEEIT